ncbi:olfactory receptor 11L1-like [Gastrophryne carolinensis]
MKAGNHSIIMEVWVTGVAHRQSTRMSLFIFFLTLYLTIIMGNLLIISAVLCDKRLHTPMYYFLCSLSFSEISFITNLIPFFLQVLWDDGSSMNLNNCLAQFYICGSLGATECMLFASMSYDRYLAICKPLHYFSMMSSTFCGQLVCLSWSCAFAAMSITLILVTHLDFCGPKIIDHFFCDFAPILELSCSETYVVEFETFIFTSLVTLFPFAFVIGTYVFIIHAIMKIPSSTGRWKTFSTCSSHLAAVGTYYGTLIIVYEVPTQNMSHTVTKTLSLMYTVVTPLFNPIIYSLRNKQIQISLLSFLRKCIR